MSGSDLTAIVALTVAGAAAGSFVALASLRLPLDEPVVAGRSRCRGCGATLGAAELVPVLSFAALRGRCRRCGAAIPWRHPAIELGGAAIGLVAAIVLPIPDAIIATVLGCWLLLLAVLDGEHLWLPRALSLPLGALGLIAALAAGPRRAIDGVAGAVAGYLVLSAAALAYRRWRGRDGLGGGDPILFGVAGAWVGWQGLPAVLAIAAWSALALFLPLMLSGRWSRDRPLPFGCFLAAATWAVWLLARR